MALEGFVETREMRERGRVHTHACMPYKACPTFSSAKQEWPSTKCTRLGEVTWELMLLKILAQ
jgi:hypothetical protein